MAATVFARPRDGSVVSWRWLMFLFVPPLALGFAMGWHRAGAGALLPREAAIVLWSLNWLVFWWLAECLLRLMRAFLRPWTQSRWPPFVAATMLVVLLSSVTVPLLMTAVAAAFEVPMPYGAGATGRSLLDWSYLVVLAQACAPGIVMWLALRLSIIGDAQLTGVAIPTKLSEPPRPARSDETPPTGASWEFESALRRAGAVEHLAEVIAIEAQDHYVFVSFTTRKLLVHFRFRDAMAAFPFETGVQLNRSVWVRRSAMIGAEGHHVRISNGESYAVSRERRALIATLLREKQA